MVCLFLFYTAMRTSVNLPPDAALVYGSSNAGSECYASDPEMNRIMMDACSALNLAVSAVFGPFDSSHITTSQNGCDFARK